MRLSKRRMWLLLAPVVLVLVAFGATRLRPVSPLRNAYNQIREGMDVVQIEEILERCGLNKYRTPTGREDPVIDTYFSISLPLTYQGGDGDTLMIRWQGYVAGKEYHSGIEMKLRGLWDRLRRSFHW